ncbi:MAG: hypothetical protein ACRD9L_10875, partial [Bryobacteraceae bacterium]
MACSRPRSEPFYPHASMGMKKEDILMSSAAQLEANRRNAQLCTGPRTEAGKEVSKFNALRHGLASAQVVLPHEDRAAFEELKAALIAEHQPAGPTEQLLVVQLAETWWRSLRAHRVESEYLTQVALAPGDAAVAPGPVGRPQRIRRTGDAALAEAVVSERDNAFAKIQRYVTAADRAFRNTLNELRKAQHAREKAAGKARHKQELEKVREFFRASKNGFVPQSAQKT